MTSRINEPRRIGPGDVLKSVEDFDLVLHEVKADGELSGTRLCYAIKNRGTGVLEGMGMDYASMLDGLDAFQVALNEARLPREDRRGPQVPKGIRAN